MLNNEFFAQACLEWTDRLSEGEFTPEHQQKMKMDNDRDKSKLDPFKVSYLLKILKNKLLFEISNVHNPLCTIHSRTIKRSIY